jgi:starvation-inducible DNA-binding protein
MATRTAPSTSSRNGRTSRNGRASSNARTSHAASPDPKLGIRSAQLQAFGTLRRLPIGLGDEARQGSCTALNEILADSMVLYGLYKKHHWLVAGPTFYQLHLLFDKHATEQEELIDLLAERVQSLGGIAVGDPRHAAELTTIPRPPDGPEEVATMVDRTLAAHEIVIRKVRAAITATEEAEDWGSNDLLMGDQLRRHVLQVCCLAEHVVDVRLID